MIRHREQINESLVKELAHGLRLDVSDLPEVIFKRVPNLNELAKRVFDICQDGDAPIYEDNRWKDWPSDAVEDQVLKWLQDLMKFFIKTMKGLDSDPVACRQIYQEPNLYHQRSGSRQKMDVGLIACQGENIEEDVSHASTKSSPNRTDILVTGKLKRHSKDDGCLSTLLDLATYAREVFRVQDRRFVLGFTICGFMMRLWQFDRSGCSGSLSFDIHKDGLQFSRVMLGYLMMNETQLGFDPTIQQADGRHYVEITRNGQMERLIIEKRVSKQAIIAGPGTSCWKAYRDDDKSKEKLIIKDSWQREEHPEEGELIKEATVKGVHNIARYYHHETVQVNGKEDDVSENVREGLMKECGRTTFKTCTCIDLESSAFRCLGAGGLSSSNSGSLSSGEQWSDEADEELPPKKRVCFQPSSREAAKPIDNRVHRRIITRDAGKSLDTGSSLGAVLDGIIGAIKGHESLYRAGILHRDISHGNIMLSEQDGDGFLIDLDHAIRLVEHKPSKGARKTGTGVFMAIQVLMGEHHTFKHDLESFFWVLFWLGIHWDGPNRKRRTGTVFSKWNTMTTRDLAIAKMGEVFDADIFSEDMENHFSDYCKALIPCLMGLHDEIFGPLWRKDDDEALYSRMINVLEEARQEL